jgi:CRP-like cAMP-binding protein
MSVEFLPETRKVLLQLMLFQGLRETELDILLSRSSFIECPMGEYPIREGEQGNNLFVLLAGNARISKLVKNQQKTLRLLGAGECFGEMSLIECRSRSASVMAITDCKLLMIKGEHIAYFPEIATKVYRNIAITLAQRLRHANDMLTLG